MRYTYIFTGILLLLPLITRAAGFDTCSPPDDVKAFGLCLILFFNIVLVPFLFSLALLFFIYNVIKYFIVDINNASGKENARRYALYGIAGFVLMVSLWGVVNLLVGGIFGSNISNPVCPDIFPSCNSVSR